MTKLNELPFLTDRPRMACPKGPTRLERRTAKKRITVVDERKFRLAVWARDKNRCRCCGRKVQKILGRVPERGEVHHCSGRRGDLRFLSQGALLLCLTCHERVTGKVNDKLIIVPSITFEFKGRQLTDARHPVTFQEMR